MGVKLSDGQYAVDAIGDPGIYDLIRDYAKKMTPVYRELRRGYSDFERVNEQYVYDQMLEGYGIAIDRYFEDLDEWVENGCEYNIPVVDLRMGHLRIAIQRDTTEDFNSLIIGVGEEEHIS